MDAGPVKAGEPAAQAHVSTNDAPGIAHVADTAFLIAHNRAVESARPDALFRDPLAAVLAGEKGKALAEAFPTAQMTTWMVAVRTFVIDEFIRRAISGSAARPPVRMIVNLGAGLDTRPYRLDLPPDLSWTEVDYPDLLTFKQSRLKGEVPHCRLEQLAVDLTDPFARRSLFRELQGRGQRMLILTEGVVPYLTEEDAGALADDLRVLSQVDSWIVEYLAPDTQKYRRRSGVERHMRRAPFKFQPPDWFGFFAAHGWQPRDVRYLAQVGAQMGRPAPLPWRARLLISLLRRFTPADKRQRFQRFSGYILLEPSSA